MKEFMWFITEVCVAMVLVVITGVLVFGVSEHFNGVFRGLLAYIISVWFVSELKEK